jgi:hypothetical protein
LRAKGVPRSVPQSLGEGGLSFYGRSETSRASGGKPSSGHDISGCNTYQERRDEVCLSSPKPFRPNATVCRRYKQPLRNASGHTTLALPNTHPNIVLGKLLCIYPFKTIVALWNLKDISRPGPDKPLPINAFGRFWWTKSRTFEGPQQAPLVELIFLTSALGL